jgi:hypothetical protein
VDSLRVDPLRSARLPSGGPRSVVPLCPGCLLWTYRLGSRVRGEGRTRTAGRMSRANRRTVTTRTVLARTVTIRRTANRPMTTVPMTTALTTTVPTTTLPMMIVPMRTGRVVAWSAGLRCGPSHPVDHPRLPAAPAVATVVDQAIEVDPATGDRVAGDRVTGDQTTGNEATGTPTTGDLTTGNPATGKDLVIGADRAIGGPVVAGRATRSDRAVAGARRARAKGPGGRARKTGRRTDRRSRNRLAGATF